MPRQLPPDDLPSHYQSCVSIFVPHLQKLKSDKEDAPWDELEDLVTEGVSKKRLQPNTRGVLKKDKLVELQENTVTLTSWLSE